MMLNYIFIFEGVTSPLKFRECLRILKVLIMQNYAKPVENGINETAQTNDRKKSVNNRNITLSQHLYKFVGTFKIIVEILLYTCVFLALVLCQSVLISNRRGQKLLLSNDHRVLK